MMKWKKLKCVADTSTIIRLRKGGAIYLLSEMFETVYIPNAVAYECKDTKTKKAIENSLFVVAPVKNILSIDNIHIGELEAISLTVELGLDLILLDDAGAIAESNKYNLISLSTFDNLLAAKNKWLIRSVKPIMDLMISENERIYNSKYIKMLFKAAEIQI